jgi:hypothetical protein
MLLGKMLLNYCPFDDTMFNKVFFNELSFGEISFFYDLLVDAILF